MPHQIATAFDVEAARAAIRDVLYLYNDIAQYDGIVGDHDVGTFDAFRYVNCTDDRGSLGEGNLQLLREGSAVAILGKLIDLHDGAGGSDANLKRCRLYAEAGHFAHLPVAEAAFSVAVDRKVDPTSLGSPLFEAYVAGYFRRALGPPN